VVSAQWSFNTLRRRCLAVTEGDISMNVEWMSRADCVASSVAGYNSNGLFFPLWRHLKEHIYGLLKISRQDFKQLWQQPMPTWMGTFKRMPCHIAIFLEMDGGCYKRLL
jgi:hypothetical protein